MFVDTRCTCLIILFITMRTEQLQFSVFRDAARAHTPTHSYSYMCNISTRLMQCGTQNNTYLNKRKTTTATTRRISAEADRFSSVERMTAIVCRVRLYTSNKTGSERKLEQLTVFHEYTRYEEITVFCVTTSILVVRKKQLQFNVVTNCSNKVKK